MGRTWQFNAKLRRQKIAALAIRIEMLSGVVIPQIAITGGTTPSSGQRPDSDAKYIQVLLGQCGKPLTQPSNVGYTLREFNIAIENCQFLVDLPIQKCDVP